MWLTILAMNSFNSNIQQQVSYWSPLFVVVQLIYMVLLACTSSIISQLHNHEISYWSPLFVVGQLIYMVLLACTSSIISQLHNHSSMLHSILASYHHNASAGAPFMEVIWCRTTFHKSIQTNMSTVSCIVACYELLFSLSCVWCRQLHGSVSRASLFTIMRMMPPLPRFSRLCADRFFVLSVWANFYSDPEILVHKAHKWTLPHVLQISNTRFL